MNSSQHKLPILVGLSLIVASACDDAAGAGPNTPTPATAVNPSAIVGELYPMIMRGEGERLIDVFAAGPNIDTPRTGALKGQAAWRRFVTEERQWLMALGVEAAGLQPVRTFKSASRVVHELVITTNVGDQRLPNKLAIVADIAGAKLQALRVYYTYARLGGGEDFLRPSMLPYDVAAYAAIAPTVRRYVDAIAASDPFAWKLFTPAGSFNGPENVPLTGQLLMKFYAVLAGEPGGVPLRPVTVTCDETACAIEENLESWGQIRFAQNTAGLAVYEFDPASDRLSAARVYDDIPVTPFTKPDWIYDNWESISRALAEAGCTIAYKPERSLPARAVVLAYFGSPCEHE